MSVMDVLKKLGIIRCEGTAATYTNAKDRPKEFMMDEVDNSQNQNTSSSDTSTDPGD
jgi:hypothetical protein